jgi:hypothetical protein
MIEIISTLVAQEKNDYLKGCRRIELLRDVVRLQKFIEL